jgi:hypothetical protein
MASLHCLSPVMPLVVVLSGVVLSVVICCPLPHCHPPPSHLLLSALPLLLLSVAVVIVIVIRHPPSLLSAIHRCHCHHPPSPMRCLILVSFFCHHCVFLCHCLSSSLCLLHHCCHVALHGLPSSLAVQPSNPLAVDCCKHLLYYCLSTVLGLARGLIWLS